MNAVKHGARIGVLLCIAAAVAACTRLHDTPARARVPRGSVTGRAAAAVGDSGVFASPVISHDVRPVIPHADAESAAVAFGYWDAPSFQDRTVRYFHVIPTERRHFCGRTYYVRPVVVRPDTTVVRSNSLNDWMLWAPTWVMPICDDKGKVRTSVQLADVVTGLRVLQGPAAHDVPELVPDSGTFPHIGQLKSKQMRNWERGIGMTPETAVAVAAELLRKSGARVAEVPEAFPMVRLLDSVPPATDSSRIFADPTACPRWRLTLDRPVTLRGTTSRRVVRTQTVFVTRNDGGCRGSPLLQIPKPMQPTTVPFSYVVSQSPPASHQVGPHSLDIRWTTLRVVEPLWFEDARLGP